ncbi:MAG: signal peptidase II [Bdellovibrionales bacterium]|nr:signal peptidase II [Bdellovibrionales bacterium]
MSRKYLFLATLAGAIVTLDQLTKLYVHTQFYLGETLPILEGYFNLTYVRNTGAAFGILRDSAESFRKIFFLSMPPLAMIVILSILWSVEEKDRLQVFALSNIFGGAVGNYIDRLRFGYVIDFIDLHYKYYYTWPAFNIADSCIVGGISILMFIMFRQYLSELKMRKSTPQSSSSSPLPPTGENG